MSQYDGEVIALSLYEGEVIALCHCIMERLVCLVSGHAVHCGEENEI